MPQAANKEEKAGVLLLCGDLYGPATHRQIFWVVGDPRLSCQQIFAFPVPPDTKQSSIW